MWVIELLQSIGLAGQITVGVALLIAAFYLKRLVAIGAMIGSIVSVTAIVLIIIAAGSVFGWFELDLSALLNDLQILRELIATLMELVAS